MLSKQSLYAALVATVVAHGVHEDQSPILGPHQSLWYNTLPGDGGTQVQKPTMPIDIHWLTKCLGRLCVLGYLDIWTSAVR